MTETLAAILTAFDASMSPSPFTGGLYFIKVPSAVSPSYPYCVIRQIPGKGNDNAFGGKIAENPVIQFEAYNNGGSAALANIETVAAAFDALYRGGAVTLTSGRWLSCQRQREPIVTDEGKDQDGNDVWRAFVRYTLGIQKN